MPNPGQETQTLPETKLGTLNLQQARRHSKSVTAGTETSTGSEPLFHALHSANGMSIVREYLTALSRKNLQLDPIGCKSRARCCSGGRRMENKHRQARDVRCLQQGMMLQEKKSPSHLHLHPHHHVGGYPRLVICPGCSSLERHVVSGWRGTRPLRET